MGSPGRWGAFASAPAAGGALPWALQSAQTSLLLRRFDMVRGGGTGRFLPR